MPKRRVRREDIPQVWGVSEVAEFLEVQVPNLSGKNLPAGMPPPFQTIRASRLWIADEIREWGPEWKVRRHRRGRSAA